MRMAMDDREFYGALGEKIRYYRKRRGMTEWYKKSPVRDRAFALELLTRFELVTSSLPRTCSAY